MGTFTNYALLGDDIDIWDETVAINYQVFMNALDVTVSQAKSYVPTKEGSSYKTPYKAEFAKRIYKSGLEYSGLSPGLLKEGMKTPWACPEFVTFLVKHGFPEIATVPISRFIKLYRPGSVKNNEFVCSFIVNRVLGGPQFPVDVTVDEPESILNITPSILLGVRSEMLDKATDDLIGDMLDDYDFETGEFEEIEEEHKPDKSPRVELENLLGFRFNSGSLETVYERVLSTRKKQVIDLQIQMAGCVTLLEKTQKEIGDEG